MCPCFRFWSGDAEISPPMSLLRRPVRDQTYGSARHLPVHCLLNILAPLSRNQTAGHFTLCPGAVIHITSLSQSIYCVVPHLYIDSDIILSKRDPENDASDIATNKSYVLGNLQKIKTPPGFISLGKASGPFNIKIHA